MENCKKRCSVKHGGETRKKPELIAGYGFHATTDFNNKEEIINYSYALMIRTAVYN